MDAAYAGTITVGRQAKDRFGDPVGDMDTHTIDGCIPYPAGSTEVANRSDSVTTGNGVLVPIGSDIKASDVVWLPGEDTSDRPRWQVDGEPGVYPSPFTGWQPGTQVELKNYEG